MSSELVTVAQDLHAYLTDQCPKAWKITNAEELGKTKTTGVVLTWEQLDISIESLGQELPAGAVWVTFQLVLSVPETNATRALPRLTRAMSDLIPVLDAAPEFRWGPDATRTRLVTGESAYLIPIAALVTNHKE